jgi:hypothetical protein
MDCSERSNITILVVDHDEVSLAFVANILMERQYKGTLPLVYLSIA